MREKQSVRHGGRWCWAIMLIGLSATGMAHAASCNVESASSINFGNYYPLQTSATLSQGTMTVRCTAPATFTLELGPGGSGSYHPRYMLSGLAGKRMAYQLYADPAYTIVWGNGTANTQTVTKSYSGAPVTIHVYGRIPGRQTTIGTGTFSDNITLTVSY